MIVAFDIDGTISNNAHREHFAQAKQWDEFHALAHLDKPIQETMEVLYSLQNRGHIIELWTARPDNARTQTEEWVATHNLQDCKLFMRKTGDWRRAFILKLEWYLQREPKFRPALVFEDHPETVKLLRFAGARVHQVAEGNY